ncbi:unnamed protein product [Protopolystoma xenopodis]|uniref:Uncharacterized protein n=1 Tax=Protopolystoma xenopodis TaxID=117903 RepID=A0A448WAG8_9PLAT|nr:unnamed protein product [Protopolystoma xenopodis]
MEFIQCLTPLTNLHSLSLMLHSQEHCLRLSMWLIYRGHAIIIYPIAGNNTYILSPFFGHWFQPYMVLQFATAYPCINLAEVILASFSNGVTLKDTGPENRTSTYQLCSDTDYSDQANYRWSNLPSSTKVGIITWLLRRRLIIQDESAFDLAYFFANCLPFMPPRLKQHLLNSSGLKNFGPPKEVSLHCSLAQQVLADQIVRSKSCYSERRHPIRRGRKLKGSKPVCIMTNGDSEEDRIRLIQLVAGPHLPDSLVVNLARALPSRDHLVGFLSYPGLLEDIRLLMVFLRLLPRLPAHFEELLFTEADLSRQTLTACLQRYSAFLLTFHTPDPVTACFTGINWPD